MIHFHKEKRVEKVFSPRCSSSFPNLKSSENCLIERERGFLPLSLYPRCSVAVLHFIVLTNPEKRPPQSLRRAFSERERGEDEKYESLPEDIAACAPVLRSTNILCAFRIPEMLRLMVNSL